MGTDYRRGLYKEYELLMTENEELKAKYKLLQYEHKLLQKELKLSEKLEAELAQKVAENDALAKELVRLTALLNIDGTNSGTSTSKTPISKKKVIPNSRKKNGKKIGGQPGHPKKKLEAFDEQEVTEIEIHKPEICPFCSGNVEETGKKIGRASCRERV